MSERHRAHLITWRSERVLQFQGSDNDQPDAAAREASAGMLSASQSSVLDLMQGRWFGSCSSDSSKGGGSFHDSVSSYSPGETKHRTFVSTVGFSPETKLVDGFGFANDYAYSNGQATGLTDRMRLMAAAAANGITDSVKDHRVHGGSTRGTRKQSPSAHNSNGSNGSGSHTSSACRTITAVPAARSMHSRLPSVRQCWSGPTTPEWGDLSQRNVGHLSRDNSQVQDLLGDAPEVSTASNSGELSVSAPASSVSDLLSRAVTPLEPETCQEPSGEFGTWAQRQKHFLSATLDADSTQDATRDGATAKYSQANGTVDQSSRGTTIGTDMKARNRPTVAHRRQESKDDEDLITERAWRWRFGRRWAAEQAKAFDLTQVAPDDEDEDTWDEALKYLGAVGASNMQLGRTTSVESNLEQLSLNRNSSDGFLLDADPHLDEIRAKRADYTATRSLVSKARKAAQLRAHQPDIDREVSRQWCDAYGSAIRWGGQVLRPVSISMHGKLSYALLRTTDSRNVHKMLVRGRNNRTPDQILQETRVEVAQEAASRGVAAARVELLGSGLMTWTGSIVHMTQSRVLPGVDKSIRANADVSRVAAALTQCSLTGSQKVSVGV